METITKKQFHTYLRIRDVGAVNMFDVRGIARMSRAEGCELNREQVLTIIENFSELMEKFGAE